MDISMSDMDGVEATRIVKNELPQVHVIGLSMFEEEQVTQAMIRSGAKAFVSKAAPTSELLETIYTAVRGK